jgi:hypothetical protein
MFDHLQFPSNDMLFHMGTGRSTFPAGHCPGSTHAGQDGLKLLYTRIPGFFAMNKDAALN